MLSEQERIRYNRQIIIQGFGDQGQEKLSQAKVFIAGSGGLGSISGYYMAAAGIGNLTIADMDVVSEENLNRQIIHRTSDISRPKVESAYEKLTALNPFCKIRTIYERITEENVLALIDDAMLIMDATDNYQIRKILNRASIHKQIPFIHGGINGFNGMVSTFVPNQTPCFECIFPDDPKPPSGKFGVIGPTPGMVASIQSMEAIKYIAGFDSGLKGKLLYIYGIGMDFKKIEIKRNPACTVCGQVQK